MAQTDESARSVNEYLNTMSKSAQPTGDDQYVVFIFAMTVVVLILGGLFIWLKFGSGKKEEQKAESGQDLATRMTLLEAKESERVERSKEFREETRQRLLDIESTMHEIQTSIAVILEKLKQ